MTVHTRSILISFVVNRVQKFSVSLFARMKRLDNKMHSVTIFWFYANERKTKKLEIRSSHYHTHLIDNFLPWKCSQNYLKISIQSGWVNLGPVRNACCLHGSSITQAFGPYSSKIFLTAKSTSIDGGTDSSPDDEKSRDARRTRDWYVSANDKVVDGNEEMNSHYTNSFAAK